MHILCMLAWKNKLYMGFMLKIKSSTSEEFKKDKDPITFGF